jgi:hypothetical protein
MKHLLEVSVTIQCNDTSGGRSPHNLPEVIDKAFDVTDEANNHHNNLERTNNKPIAHGQPSG